MKSFFHTQSDIGQSILTSIDSECEVILPLRLAYGSDDICREAFLIGLSDDAHDTDRSTDIAKERTHLIVCIRK
jgi:hypothetical protein